MKKLFIMALAAVAAISCANKPGYTVTVNLEDDSFKSIILTNNAKENPIADTVTVENKKAVFTGEIATFDVFSILGVKEGEDPKPLKRNIFLENANYTITVPADLENDKVKVECNSPIQNQSDSLDKVANEFYKDVDMNQLQKEYMEGDAETKERIMNQVQAITEKAQDAINNFMNQNPTSAIALYNAASEINYLSADSARKIVDKFAEAPEYAENRFYKAMTEALAKKEAVAVGKTAPDFTLNDPDGNPVTFSEFYKKNKVTMVDFWASWCGPCRRFNPTLTKIYAKYSKKGLGILGVSLDRDKDNWLKAIKDDKLVWSHVSDLQYWDCAAAKLFNISYIPQSYFVDSEGKILLAAPKEEEIEAFLADYLK